MLALLLLSWKPPQDGKWLLVIHADKGSVTSTALQMERANPVVAAIGPEGEVKTMHLKEALDDWDESFGKVPPHAALAFIGKEGQIHENLLILNEPTYKNDTLSFKILPVGKPLLGPTQSAVLYISNWCGAGPGIHCK